MNEQDLRDCFAMFAMNGLLSNGFTDYSVAEVAYKMADQMLEARTGKGSVGLPPVRARKTKEK